MSIWGTLGKIGLAGAGAIAAPFTGGASLAAVLPSIIGAAGAGIGGIAASHANNRGEKYSGQLDLERLLLEREQQNQQMQIAREQEGRAGTSDAWRKLLSSSHTLSPGAHPQLSPYSVAPRQITPQESTGGNALMEEALKRLQGGNPIAAPVQHPLNVDQNLLNAGGFEKFANFASPALTLWSQLVKKPTQAPANV